MGFCRTLRIRITFQFAKNGKKRILKNNRLKLIEEENLRMAGGDDGVNNNHMDRPEAAVLCDRFSNCKICSRRVFSV